MKPVEKPHIGVLGFSLDLYQETIPDSMDIFRKQLAAFQKKVEKYADITCSTFCCTEDHVVQGITCAEKDDADAVLIIPLSYTTSLTSLKTLLATSIPVIIWNTQEAEGFGSSYDFDVLLKNHVTQGTQDITNVLLRNKKIFGMESGHFKNDKALAELDKWLRAARTAQFSKKMKVGILGEPFPGMGDFEVDEIAMKQKWGPTIVRLSMDRFNELIGQASQTDISDLMSDDKKIFDISDEIPEKIHSLSSKLEVGLRGMVGENNLDAFTMNFLDLINDGRISTLPFLGINKLMGEGLGYAGEGNLVTAAHMAQIRQLCGEANFTEIYTVDYLQNRMMMTHMQECNPALARKDRKIRLVKKDFWAPGIEPYVGMHFTLEPGQVTLTTMTTDSNDNFFYIAYETEIEDMEPLEYFDIPHWVVALKEPVSEFLTRYSMTGGMHHLVAVPGHISGTIQRLAHLQGFEYKKI